MGEVLNILCNGLIIVAVVFLLRYGYVYLTIRYDTKKKIFDRIIVTVGIFVLCGLLFMLYLACEDLKQFVLFMLIGCLLLVPCLLYYFRDKMPEGLQKFWGFFYAILRIVDLFDWKDSTNWPDDIENGFQKSLTRIDNKIKKHVSDKAKRDKNNVKGSIEIKEVDEITDVYEQYIEKSLDEAEFEAEKADNHYTHEEVFGRIGSQLDESHSGKEKSKFR